MCVGGSIWKNSVSYSQFCCEPKSAVEIKSLKY
jgi:hypothetical protein